MSSPTENAIHNGTTIYHNSIRIPRNTGYKSTGLRVLKSSRYNKKLGKKNSVILKGPKEFRGKHLYHLTLVERLTCPQDCQQWNVCYGNHMPFAYRSPPGAELETALVKDVHYLASIYPEGFVVRLHILGDFYNTSYVDLWRDLLHTYPNMCIYGYTHRELTTDIGNAITEMVRDFPKRVSILRSDGQDPRDPLPWALTVPKGTTPRKDILVCPEQTGKTESCLTCGLCMNGKTNIQFLEH